MRERKQMKRQIDRGKEKERERKRERKDKITRKRKKKNKAKFSRIKKDNIFLMFIFKKMSPLPDIFIASTAASSVNKKTASASIFTKN